ncbi:pyridine nucleotide-disulfide oxidoreductase-domain-containing protein [Chytriomyces sp. MP71]|nr:pyridine nucleotide-disulfide oxidoreductase-domain-containing protein [Chytriomyces sp. MP71]
MTAVIGHSTSWTVIGGGAGGIVAVASLLDNGVESSNISWVDPCFDGGLLGRKYRSVWGNTPVRLLIDFFAASRSFPPDLDRTKFPLFDPERDQDDVCTIHEFVEPLIVVAEHLRKRVVCFRENAERIEPVSGPDSPARWSIICNSGTRILTQNVILAIGSSPRSLSLPVQHQNIPIIALEDALQIDKLQTLCTPADTVAVFGSAHSAIMIVRDLLETAHVAKVVNFYRPGHDELRFCEPHPEGFGTINFINGIKGRTGVWAKNNLLQNTIGTDRLVRVPSDEENLVKLLAGVNSIIMAVGFERKTLAIDGVDWDAVGDLYTDAEVEGMIAPGIFGAGIGFPEPLPDAVGTMEYQVGLGPFMKHMLRVMPIWIATGRCE